MRIAALLLLLLSAGVLRAETVAIASGEHEGFSRIVLDLAQPTPWQFGRTADGYQLRLDRAGIRFDLREVFRTIPRTRLSAIWADPQTGDLRLGIGCACHAQPFEFRPDILVIDIRDGPPPERSSFETTLSGTPMPTLVARMPIRPRSRPAAARPSDEDWARLLRDGQAPAASLPPPELQEMRQNLLAQLSRSASQGLVDMAMPRESREVADGNPPLAAPMAADHLAAGLGPGITVLTARDPDPELTPQGDICIEDDRLEVASWADDRPFADQLAETRTTAVGEFDRPDPEAVSRQARLLLHFGFGAEARDTIEAFEIRPPDASLWETMGSIIDGDPVDPDNPFAGQADCDTNAALWSVLSRPALRLSDSPEKPAILRAFSGLPLWLRRQLGPALAERFLAIDDAPSARSVRDAMLRAPGDPGDAARLAEARLDLHDGRPEMALARIEAVAEDGGPMLPQAIIDLVDAHLSQGAPVDPETVAALSSLVQEQGEGPLGPALRRAEGLALALGGNFSSAFEISAGGNPDFDAELWPLLAKLAPDSSLLSQAVLPRGAVPETDTETGTAISRRLIDLGFPDAGLAWLPPPDGDEGRVLLAARAELIRRDARAALRVLAGQTGPEAERLRAQAQIQLGDPGAASVAFAASGDTAAAERALWQGQDWLAVATSAADPVLASAAALALPGAVPASPIAPDSDPGSPALPDGDAADRIGAATALTAGDASVPSQGTFPATPLARGRALIEDSAAARAAVAAMLEAMPGPETGSP